MALHVRPVKEKASRRLFVLLSGKSGSLHKWVAGEGTYRKFARLKRFAGHFFAYQAAGAVTGRPRYGLRSNEALDEPPAAMKK